MSWLKIPFSTLHTFPSSDSIEVGYRKNAVTIMARPVYELTSRIFLRSMIIRSLGNDHMALHKDFFLLFPLWDSKSLKDRYVVHQVSTHQELEWRYLAESKCKLFKLLEKWPSITLPSQTGTWQITNDTNSQATASSGIISHTLLYM